MLKKLGKVVVWAICLLLVVLIVFYLVLLVINWQDQPASETAVEFYTFHENRPKVDDAQNGYVYLMGFDVPKGENPQALGAQRIAWTHEEKNVEADDFLSRPGESINLTTARSGQVHELVETCTTPTADCLQQLTANPGLFTEWYETELWLTERYQNLASHSGWYESGYVDGRFSLPGYATVLSAQRLYLIHMWTLAGVNPATDVQQALNRDLTFWRSVLEQTDSLITKLVAVVAIKNNFQWSNEILRRLSVEDSPSWESMEFNKAFTEVELSMYRPMVGETAFFRNYLSDENGEFKPIDQFYSDEKLIPARLSAFVARPLFQPQDTLNAHSEVIKRMLDQFAVALDEYPAVLEKRRDAASIASDEVNYGWPLYNVSGQMSMLLLDGYLFDSYFVRVSDLEGARRALVLTVKMRDLSVSVNEVEAYIQQADVRNPYTNEALGWDASRAAILFTGLAPNQNGHHRYPY